MSQFLRNPQKDNHRKIEFFLQINQVIYVYIVYQSYKSSPAMANPTLGPCGQEHQATTRSAELPVPTTLSEALKQLISIQGERALTYTLFDEYV